MSRTARLALFAVSAVGLGAFLLWGLAGLPHFGDYAGPYGDLISNLVKPQRHFPNAVTAVVFDYRGFDTMGEELLLFAAASSVAMVLRDTREHHVADVVDRVRSPAVNAVGAVGAIVALVVALYVIAHGLLTPGGGFQGGVIAAAAFVFVFLGVEYHAYHRLAPGAFNEPLEAFGAGAYVGIGLLSLALGSAFLQTFLGLGTFGRLTAGGSDFLVNLSSGLAVAGGFLVIFSEYLQENMAERYRRT